MLEMLKWNLQWFADDEAATGEAGASEPASESKSDSKAGEARTYTDDDVDAIVAKKKASWQKQTDKLIAQEREKAESRVSEAKKLSQMNEEQKAEYELSQRDSKIDELTKELEKFKAQQAHAEMTQTAAKIMNDEYELTATPDMLTLVVADDADTTSNNIKALNNIILADRKAQDEKRAKGKTPVSYKNDTAADNPFEKIIAKYNK